MNNIGRKVELFVIIAIIAILGIVYAFTREPVQAPVSNQDNPKQQQQLVPSSLVTYQGQDGKNALELLQAGYRVEVQSFSFGDMVKSINGIEPDTNHFWAMYVNGEFSQVGASEYVTKSTDTIKWELEEISQ